jgi:DNA helicase-2/ATP-dependent DNA helicase PcrA
LAWAHRRRRFGEMVNLRSRFLDEVPDGLYEEEDFGYRTAHLYHRPTMVRRPERRPTSWVDEPVQVPVSDEPGELSVGSRVRHPQFGEGRVTRLLGGGEHLQLEVVFQGQFKKKLLAKYAKLELL